MKRHGLWLLALMVPLCAEAHSPIKGVMPFYGGALHPFVVPAHILAMLAMGLFIGQQQATQKNARLMAFLLVPLVFGLASAGWVGDPDTDVPLLLVTGLIAVAVAWARPGPVRLSQAAVAVGGLLLGWGSAPDGLAGSARWLHLAGCCLGVLVGVGWMGIVVEQVKRPWQHIAMRVVCSWIAASAFLVLALTVFRPVKGSPRPAKAEAVGAGPVFSDRTRLSSRPWAVS